jgi:hypothetical protein
LRAKAILWGKRKTFDNRKKEENAPLMCCNRKKFFLKQLLCMATKIYSTERNVYLTTSNFTRAIKLKDFL